ncbi:MAG: type II toxin-antitoxin system ParD family antitoxin [Agrobacterium albertimagni]
MTEESPSQATVQVQLEPNESAFVEQQVSNGAYASAEEMLRAGLRLLAKNERLERIKALRTMIDDADRSVEAGDFREFSKPGDLTAFIIAEAKARR